MALQVSLAHTGERKLADPAAFASIDTLRTWITKYSGIAVQDQITLTAQGRALKFQALASEKEAFIYDRRIINSSTPGSARQLRSEIPSPPVYSTTRPPDTIADQNDLQAWSDLFMTRRAWALEVVEDCAVMSEATLQRYSEMEVIARGVDAAVLNLERHVKALDQKNADIQTWVVEIQKEHDLAGADSQSALERLNAIPATGEMIRFMTGNDRKPQRKSTLAEVVDAEEVRAAGKVVRNTSTHLSRNSVDLGTKVDEVLRRTDELFEKVEKLPGLSPKVRADAPTELMHDIEAIAKKVSNDYETVLGYANTAKSISQASKSALIHTKQFLPNLQKRSLEMYELQRVATESRNAIAGDALDAMHDIATLTTLLTEANAQFVALDLDANAADALGLLSLVNTLPATYASFLAEAIRRREWTDKLKSDSSSLANEMATFHDEEVRRRRKWQKGTGTTFWGDKTECKVIGLEVNLLGEEELWPEVTRSDLDELLDIVKKQDIQSGLVNEIAKIIAELNNPTKQQSKRAKAFKAGSIHEATLGRSALLMRGDDELLRSLQDEKNKVDAKLKTAESRVRRLEDLLHRQSVTRSSTSHVFQLPGHSSPDFQPGANITTSPRLGDDMSRRSSVSSRRFSANQGQDEKAYQHKLLTLEAELIAERERVSGMEKEISARTTSAKNMKAAADEANSTKKDLMENFDAKQKEFIEERKSLEEEISRLKLRLEELEDEMDRYLGSRDNEKATVDERTRVLQDDIEKLKEHAATEAQKAQEQLDILRNEARMQRDSNKSLVAQLEKLQEEKRKLEHRLAHSDTVVSEYSSLMKRLHMTLVPDSADSDSPTDFGDALTGTAGDLMAELESVKSDAVIARSDRDIAQDALAEAKAELANVNANLVSEKNKVYRLEKARDAQQAKFSALGAELADERSQLDELRSKLAVGETGSGALRARLEDEERKATSISLDLATRQTQISTLEEELHTVQENCRLMQAKHDKLTSRFEARTSRAKDLTQRSYLQNDRLYRLLERLSYSVTREGSSMTIQRLPKPERSNTANDSSDPGSTLRRSITARGTRKAMVDSADLDLLYWMHNDDSDTESEKYEAYMNAIGSFDIEAFCEVITKRIKDIEYTAKKYSKDARAYREKSHVAQKEAHEKIAFKNFKEGDLALFLPTRNQTTGAWAAFNVGAPHYFLREQDSHKLRSRDWLLARIHKIEDRVVDLSKSISNQRHLAPSDNRSFGSASNGADSFEDDNPFDLSDGLRWYLIDAAEEKPGAPSTPGLGKSTVASTHIDATGSIRRSKKSSSSGVDGINRTLSKSLDSRRSSSNSKKAVPSATSPLANTTSTSTPVDVSSLQSVSTATVQPNDEVIPGAGAQMIPSGSKQGEVGSADNSPEDPTIVKPVSNANAQANTSTSTGTSPSKRSVIWDSLWSLDMSVESGRQSRR